MNEAARQEQESGPGIAGARVLVTLSRVAAGVVFLSLIAWGLGPHFLSGNSLTTCGKSPALGIATSLESAVNCFKIEYASLPSSKFRMMTSGAEGIEFLNVLSGREPESSEIKNLRRIRFLAIQKGSNNKGGLMFSADGRVTGVYDPWGNPYTVVMAEFSDGILRFDLAGKPVELKGRDVAVFSAGPDRKLGTSDDVRTW